jgi:heme-degrading monooxygenase HmoA
VLEVHYIEWHITPFRRDAFLEIWRPALDRALAFGARSAFLTRNEDDTLHIRQVTVWESRADQERWWASDELSALREQAMTYYHKPVEQHWHAQIANAAVQASNGSVS